MSHAINSFNILKIPLPINFIAFFIDLRLKNTGHFVLALKEAENQRSNLANQEKS